MKHIIKYLTILLICGFFIPAGAVTREEMDQARALAAKAYLRFANDGSGYLDDVSPKSMADLEKHLKAKEKENIKAFKGIAVPSGYESWTKDQLVEFWTKSFSSSSLDAKGKRGRNRAKSYISNMTVSAPVKAEPKKEEPKKETPKKEEPAPAKEEKPAAPANATPSSAAVDSAQATLEKAEAVLEGGFESVEPDPQISKVKDHSAVYVIILVILVAAVIALVVFASNVMKRNAAAARKANRANANAYSAPSTEISGGDEQLREKFNAAMNAKNRELALLTQELQNMEARNAALSKNVEELSAEVASLRRRLSEASKPRPATPSPAPAPAVAPAPAPDHTGASNPASKEGAAPLRTIYLGKVNSKGIFIRADRSLSPGNSVYRLDTADGYSGSFRVADDTSVYEMGLASPLQSLGGGCVNPELEATTGKSRIVTDTAGTAIFDGGCWKVLRKAKIHYE